MLKAFRKTLEEGMFKFIIGMEVLEFYFSLICDAILQ